GSVGIGYLERFIGDYALKAKSEIKPAAKNGRKAAVIGSGPSGLTAAADLALAGFEVTIYESLHKAGGVLIYGIPEFRLPKDIVEREIETLLDLGVKIELNAVIGKTITVDELMKENDAVYIATGAGLPSFLGVKGENLNGVYSANEYLTRVNLMKAYREDSDTPLIRGKNVVVVGAGNVAMDSARTALRLGGKVTLVYRRTREEMPARAEEIEHALEEGVEFRLLTNPIEILGENGRVTGIRCIKMELGEPDASGRRRPIAVPGSEHEIACDQVIVALGTTPNPLLKNSFKRLNTTDKGTILINENGETNVENLFAGGDAVTGAATVILAMGAGKTAARTIIERFKNNN
ncbi:MAG TPA: FAD-dependent oxidoreductase, partial [Eubacteriales bacterium]|nr:FAD-dependent oxidoreductase [Eubacteriales bacterium]